MSRSTSNTKEAVITLRDGNAFVEIKDLRTGAIQSKGLSTEALGDAFNAHTSMRTPLLPGQWGTRFYAKKGNKEFFLMTVAPRERELKWDTGYDDEDDDYPSYDSYKIETPPLAWFVTLQKNGESYQITDSHLFAIKNDLITMQDELFYAPYTNVYNNHTICWNGAISMNLPSPAAIISLDAAFFNAPFNSDLDDRKYLRRGALSNSSSVYESFEALDGKSFPIEALRPANTNIGQFINQIMN